MNMSNLVISDNVLRDIQATLFNVRIEDVPFVNKNRNLSDNVVNNISGIYTGETGIDWDNRTGYQMIINDEKDKVLSVASKQYSIIKNKQIFQMMEDVAIQMGTRIIVKEASMFAYKRFKYVFTFEAIQRTVSNELIMPQITIINAYEPGYRLKVIGGMQVLVCTNGLMMNKVVDMFSKVHTGEIVLPNMVESVQGVIESSWKFAEKSFDLLRSIDYSPEGLITMLGMFPREGKDRIIEYVKKENTTTYYDLLQAGTYVLTHELDRETETVHNIEQSFYSGLINIADKDKNQKLLL